MSTPQDAPVPLMVIVGPTGAGKTALALERAARLGGEIVSADSVQVYVGLDIGSAKPTPEERALVRHWAIDLWSPTEQANAGAWVAVAEAAIADIVARGRLPIVCGGTGLYVRALLEGLADIPPVPEAIQRQVRQRLAEEGPRALHAELAAVDPETARRLAPGDSQRIARALEVHRATGEPIARFQERHRTQRAARYAAYMTGVFPPREVLERRIAARARRMLDAGLVEEVRALLAAGTPPEAPGLVTLGYREVVAHLVSRPLSADALAEALTLAHRRYAKRQLTWWRKTDFDERVD